MFFSLGAMYVVYPLPFRQGSAGAEKAEHGGGRDTVSF